MNQLYIFELNNRDGLSPMEYWDPIIKVQVQAAIDAGSPPVTSWGWYGRNVGGPMFMLCLVNPSQEFLDGLAQYVTCLEKDVSIFNNDLPLGFKIKQAPVLAPEDIMPEPERDEDFNIIIPETPPERIGVKWNIVGQAPIEEVVFYAEEV